MLAGLDEYLRGQNAGLLPLLTTHLPTGQRFMTQLLEADLSSLQEFFEAGPKRNLALAAKLNSRSHILRQSDLAELLVATRNSRQPKTAAPDLTSGI